MAKSLREVLQAPKANSPGQDHRHQPSNIPAIAATP